MLSSESKINLGELISGRLTDLDTEILIKAGSRISGMEIFIDDTGSLGIMELKSKVRRLHRKNKLGICFVDYIQLISDNSKNNREQEISSISRNLKSLAKELSIPVITLCQLSREVEKRSDKTPQLSDLRESGAIEQDADIVMFLYRPEYYGLTEDENGNSTEGLCTIKIAKHRNGQLGEVKLKSDLGTQSFSGWQGETIIKGFVPIKTKQEDLF
jgi:replicative DNA helicase